MGAVIHQHAVSGEVSLLAAAGFVLFRMDADGGNIRPLSYANLSEWTPSVMQDGRIIWMRSEYLDKGADFGHTLWAIRPDGTHPELLFGNNTLVLCERARGSGLE